MLKIAAMQGTVAVGDTVTYPDGTRAKVVGVARRARKAAKKAGKKDTRIKAPKKPKKAKADPIPRGDFRPGSKLALIDGLLRRPGGCTRKEAMAAASWPSISMQQQATALGASLKSEKKDGVTRYWIE